MQQYFENGISLCKNLKSIVYTEHCEQYKTIWNCLEQWKGCKLFAVIGDYKSRIPGEYGLGVMPRFLLLSVDLHMFRYTIRHDPGMCSRSSLEQ